jgi:YD repeat-containing protein
MRQLLSKVLFTLKLVFLSSSSWCYAIAVPADVSSYYSVDGQKFGTDQSEAVLATMNRVQATTYWFRCALPRPEIDPIHETTIFCFHGYPNQSYYDSDICKYIVWNYKIPSCPPKNANGQSYSSYTILSDANGTPSSSGQYCTKPCIAPFAFEGNQCVTYCPPGESLDLNLGRCVGNQSVIPEAKQYCGNPVVINDGEKVQHEEPDLASSGPFPLSFERAYYSRAVIDAESQSNTLLHSSLPDTEKAKWTRYVQPSDYEGPTVEWVTSTPIPQVIGDFPSVGHRQWLNNFNYYLATRGDGSVVVLLPNNEHLTFSAQSGNTYRLSAPSAVTLTRNLDSSGVVQSWTYRDAENMQYVFAPAGYLTQIIHPTGLSQWLSFDSTTGLLSSVRDDFGNQFTFTYANGLLTSVASNSGAQASYAYDQYGNLGTVTKTSADGKTTTRQYHYEDTRFPYALTGITDERGIRYATWRYDAVGRAIESAHAGGADKTTFAYDIDSTTVTNPLGKSDIYRYAQVGGARRLVSVDGQASTSCLAANKGYTYNSDGSLQMKTDQKGIVTRYEYNARGLITKLTEADGTPEQRVTVTEWHPTLPLPTKVTQGTQVVTYTYDAQGRLLNRRIGN